MEQKLKYNKRVKSEVQITNEEREEIAERIIKFMRESLVLDSYTSEEKDSGKKYKGYCFCFCGGKAGESYYNRLWEKDNFHISDERLLYEFEWTIFERFKYHIRLNASIIHIKKLIEILGKKVASSVLTDWAKRNMAVAIVLKQISEELIQSDNSKTLANANPTEDLI